MSECDTNYTLILGEAAVEELTRRKESLVAAEGQSAEGLPKISQDTRDAVIRIFGLKDDWNTLVRNARLNGNQIVSLEEAQRVVKNEELPYLGRHAPRLRDYLKSWMRKDFGENNTSLVCATVSAVVVLKAFRLAVGDITPALDNAIISGQDKIVEAAFEKPRIKRNYGDIFDRVEQEEAGLPLYQIHLRHLVNRVVDLAADENSAKDGAYKMYHILEQVWPLIDFSKVEAPSTISQEAD